MFKHFCSHGPFRGKVYIRAQKHAKERIGIDWMGFTILDKIDKASVTKRVYLN